MLITRYLDVKGRGLGIHATDGSFPVEFRRFENIIPAEPIELARESSSKGSEVSTSFC
jgi:hypothetical protein